MNQGEMVDRLAWEFNLPKAECRRILKFFLEEMKKDLMVGERVCFRGFGSFEKVKREERKARHSETGEMMTIPEHFTVNFTRFSGKVSLKFSTRPKTKWYENRKKLLLLLVQLFMMDVSGGPPCTHFRLLLG